MNTNTRSPSSSVQDLPPEHELSGIQLQLETRERLVRLEEENRYLRDQLKELGDKQRRLRQNADDERTAGQQQINDRAGKLGLRIDTLSRRLDRLFSFWMMSTMLLMLFAVALMFRLGY